jgi:hypothetical protein
MVDAETGPDALKIAVQSFEPADDKSIRILVRLSNTAPRALHYISDVRTTKYDPATKVLRVGLSDDGRQVIPGAIQKLPVFRFIDPGGEAEVLLTIPNRVVKLAKSDPPGQVAFETHELSELEAVEVEIGWADIPYYEDTRNKDDPRLPASRWQQAKAHATARRDTGGGGGRKPRKR